MEDVLKKITKMSWKQTAKKSCETCTVKTTTTATRTVITEDSEYKTVHCKDIKHPSLVKVCFGNENYETQLTNIHSFLF